MHRHGLWILSLVLAMSSLSSVATSQTEPAAVPPAVSAGAVDTANVGPDTPVLTVDGFCGTDPNAKQKAPCRTVLTRTEFEKLAGESHR